MALRQVSAEFGVHKDSVTASTLLISAVGSLIITSSFASGFLLVNLILTRERSYTYLANVAHQLPHSGRHLLQILGYYYCDHMHSCGILSAQAVTVGSDISQKVSSCLPSCEGYSQHLFVVQFPPVCAFSVFMQPGPDIDTL